jgi:two-component system sensor histidine kinase MtrB
MALAHIQPLADSKGSTLEIDIPNGPVEAEFDPRRIERVLRNLLSNAIEHGEGKPIRVEVGQSATAVAVTVTDYGVGMSQAQVARVFDRFWRADPARKRTTGGTGLGLAIALADTTLHNGWLQLVSAPNKGTTFRLTLPRKQKVLFTQSPSAGNRCPAADRLRNHPSVRPNRLRPRSRFWPEQRRGLLLADRPIRRCLRRRDSLRLLEFG